MRDALEREQGQKHWELMALVILPSDASDGQLLELEEEVYGEVDDEREEREEAEANEEIEEEENEEEN